MNGRLYETLNKIGHMPGVVQLRRRRFDSRFERGQAISCFRGVYDSYSQAVAAAPKAVAVGYDNAESANLYRDRLDKVYPSDYPMMMWLQKAFNEGARKVMDLGGHIGVAYYAYQRLIDFPRDLSWIVNDVPAVIESGRSEATERDPSGRLSFSEGFDVAADADLLFTAGCVQYLEDTLAQQLAALKRRPRWVLVNLLPLHETAEYWTVQSIGTAFCPYRIQRMSTFFADMERLGYGVLDKWENLEKRCWVAFDPEHSLDRYYGAALELTR